MSEEYSCQCVLKRVLGRDIIVQTSWIPEKYAVNGKMLSLKNSKGIWEDGWFVDTVGMKELTKVVHELSREHRTLAEKIK